VPEQYRRHSGSQWQLRPDDAHARVCFKVEVSTRNLANNRLTSIRRSTKKWRHLSAAKFREETSKKQCQRHCTPIRAPSNRPRKSFCAPQHLHIKKALGAYAGWKVVPGLAQSVVASFSDCQRSPACSGVKQIQHYVPLAACA
jgi:hypothetical protein